MSKDLNKVMIIGRLGAEPELRFTPQGTPVTTFRVACGRQWKDGDGTPREETEWFRVVAWNKLAEVCNQYLVKGSRVYVEGRLHTNKWQDKETGQDRYATEVIASDMILLDGRKDTPLAESLDSDELEDEPQPAALSTAPTRRTATPAPARATGGKEPGASRSTATSPRRSAVPEEELPF